MNPFDKVTLELNRKITSLAEENAALKEQVAQLEADNSHAGLFYEKQLTTLQSKFDVLVDALETTVPYLWNSSAIGADVVAEQTLAVIKGAK